MIMPRQSGRRLIRKVGRNGRSADAAEQRAAEMERNAIYAHPTSERLRTDRAAEQRGTAGDRMAKLRMSQRRLIAEPVWDSARLPRGSHGRGLRRGSDSDFSGRPDLP